MAVVPDVINELKGVLDTLCAADPTELADGETVQVLHRQLERLTAATTRTTAAFEAGREWEAEGARSAPAWVAVRCHQPPATGGCTSGGPCATCPRWRRRGWPGTWARPTSGCWPPPARRPRRRASSATRSCWSTSHGDALLAVRAGPGLLGPAGRSRRYRREAEAAHQARRLHLPQSLGGSWALDGVLDPINGAIVAGAIGRIEGELFTKEWAEAKARVGEGVCGTDLARTPAQRRADALVELARRAGAVPAGTRMPEPLFSVLVGYESFAGRLCELADGTVVAPGALVGWLGQAWVERVVFDGPDRVKNVGVRRRIFTGATRRAVEVRDRECFHELCEVPARDCEIDHVLPFSAGGDTVDDNGRPACGFHNRNRHRPPQPP